MKDKDFIDAINEAIRIYGSEDKLANMSGLKQPVINRIKNKKSSIENVTTGTWFKLFPDMQIDFFGTCKQKGHIATINKLLNRLTSDEQMDVILYIASRFAHAVDKNDLKK